jgi:MFS family permease
VSVTLVMPQFIAVVPRIADGHPSAGFWKGFLTALLQLGACLGAVSAGYVADRFSRRGGACRCCVWGAAMLTLAATQQSSPAWRGSCSALRSRRCVAAPQRSHARAR